MLDYQTISTQYCSAFDDSANQKGWVYVGFSCLIQRILLRRFLPGEKTLKRKIIAIVQYLALTLRKR